MLLRVILLLISSLSLTQGSAVKTDNPLKPYEYAEAYEVYSAILPTGWPWRVQNAKSLVIRSETVVYEMCLRPEAEFEEILKPAISEYVKLNEKTWLLQQRLSIEKPYELIASADFKKGDREYFSRQHPNSGGWIEMSAVGFNNDKTVAVVYMAHHCGSLCGGGGFHVLQKKDGKWSPLKWKGTSCVWMS